MLRELSAQIANEVRLMQLPSNALIAVMNKPTDSTANVGIASKYTETPIACCLSPLILPVVVSYRFWCGSLCGNGATWVFEKVGKQWKKTDSCGDWISQVGYELRCFPALPS